MILLNANTEVKNTFQKLIQTMGENVKWTGVFAVIDNYLILQGEVRSLFFNFDNRKVVSNIIDLPVKKEEMQELVVHPKVQNVLNMVLYAFGKWGTISGIKVDQNYAQLNTLFSKILSEIYVEPGYTFENFRFYKEGIRITYEDVVQLMLEAQDKPIEEPEVPEEEKQGLWHKLVWKKMQASFAKIEITAAERQKERLGHNFYLVGYLCPKCKEKLHSVVFPVNQELLVDTEEGRVYLARAYVCDQCNCFYTPRPEKLLVEGDCYEMPFGADRKAYEDYLELLGEKGAHTSNYKFNEYEMVRKAKEKQQERLAKQDDQSEKMTKEKQDAAAQQEVVDELEGLCARLAHLPDLDFSRLKARIEEGFFPEALLKKHEKQIAEQTKEREKKKQQLKKDKQSEHAKEENVNNDNANVKGHAYGQIQEKTDAIQSDTNESEQSDQILPDVTKTDRKEAQKKIEKYHARIDLLDRLSERQRQKLSHQIKQDHDLSEDEKERLLQPVRKREQELVQEELERKAANCEKYGYAQIQRTLDEIKQAEVSPEWKKSVIDSLRALRKKRGEEEVKSLMGKISLKLDRKGYKALSQQLEQYEDIDLSPYQNVLKEKRGAVEKQEIVNMVNRARKNTREDLKDLLTRLDEEDFDKDTVRPYREKIEEKIKVLDETAIAEICEDPLHMDFGDALAAYKKIEQGDFLPELKVNALELLSKRLSKIKTDESDLLVSKLKQEMKGKIKENPRHHFYPARKVLMKEATEEETRVIDYALATYATKRNLFEYPILVVDTSRNGSGKEGIILTPEHFFYSTLLNAYDIPIDSIRSIKTNSGLIGRGITIEQKNGTKTKIPYAVETAELRNWGEVLGNFISYLQEKPESRDVTYLAKEKHETICCFRCGYTYKGGTVCPKCGYKMNQ